MNRRKALGRLATLFGGAIAAPLVASASDSEAYEFVGYVDYMHPRAKELVAVTLNGRVFRPDQVVSANDRTGEMEYAIPRPDNPPYVEFRFERGEVRYLWSPI